MPTINSPAPLPQLPLPEIKPHAIQPTMQAHVPTPPLPTESTLAKKISKNAEKFKALKFCIRALATTMSPVELQDVVKKIENIYIEKINKQPWSDEKKQRVRALLHKRFEKILISSSSSHKKTLSKIPSCMASIAKNSFKFLAATTAAIPYAIQAYHHLQNSLLSRATIICYELRDYPNHPLVQFISSYFSKAMIDEKMKPFLPDPNRHAYDRVIQQAESWLSNIGFIKTLQVDEILKGYTPEDQSFIHNLLFILNYAFKESIDRVGSTLRSGVYGPDKWLTESALELKDAKIYALMAAVGFLSVYAGIKMAPPVISSTKKLIQTTLVTPFKLFCGGITKFAKKSALALSSAYDHVKSSTCTFLKKKKKSILSLKNEIMKSRA